jgi:hypothetical protein
MARMAHFSVGAMESPIMKPPEDTGWSELAIHSGSEWDGRDRPDGWFGSEYGLVNHTTGQGLPDKAMKEGVYPTVRAQRYYSGSHGCNYINGYRGHLGGDLIQMAHEGEQANGVGTTQTKKNGKIVKQGQKQSTLGHYSGNWKTDLPASLVKRWQKRWPGYSNPLDLLPGIKTCNPAYLQLETIPLTKYWIKQGFEPAFKGSYFTLAQHQTVAALALDIARRKQWPWEWWRTPRLLGHSDLTPISRHIKSGGWDPGHLLASKRFDWQLVLDHLKTIDSEIPPDYDMSQGKLPKTRKGGPWSKYK